MKYMVHSAEVTLAQAIEPPELAKLNAAFEDLSAATGILRGVAIERVSGLVGGTGRQTLRISIAELPK